VAPHQVPALKARLASHLPVLVYGRRRPAPGELRSCALRPRPPEVSSAVSSVYLDTRDLQVRG
jgi:SPX domain protein involved in polyphosphate accumulation